jgi:hypothetical protein
MAISIEIDREEDGRWIAEVRKIPGVLVYGKTKKEAIEKAKALSLRTGLNMVKRFRTLEKCFRSFHEAMVTHDITSRKIYSSGFWDSPKAQTPTE